MDIGSPPLRITQDRVNRISNNPPEILTDKGGYESKIGSLFFNLTGIDDGWIGRKDLLQAVFILLQGKFRIHPVLNFPLKVVRSLFNPINHAVKCVCQLANLAQGRFVGAASQVTLRDA